MIKVRLFGILRLDTGVKELSLEARSVKELLDAAAAELSRAKPEAGLDRKALSGCIVAVNGRQVNPSAALTDGDEVWLVPAIAGG